MNKTDLRWTDTALPDEPADAIEDEHRRLAQGWRRGWITIQRLKRRDEGRPILELVKDKNPARARSRG